MTRVVFRERLRRTDRRLGRHVNHDSASRRFAFDTSGLQVRTVRHRRRIPILDQGDLGSCTGNAGIGCLGTDPFYDTLPVGASAPYTMDEAGAVALYSAASAIDPWLGSWPPDDTGSDGLSVAKALAAAGEIAGYRHTFGLVEALETLSEWPLITGTNWYSNMYWPDDSGIVSPAGSLSGGHEYVVDEYDDTTGLVGFSNSWGPGWGVAGRFYMRAADWGRLLGEDGDVTVFVPVTVPAPTPDPDPDPGVVADRMFAEVLRRRGWVSKWHWGDCAKVAAAARRWLTDKDL